MIRPIPSAMPNGPRFKTAFLPILFALLLTRPGDLTAWKPNKRAEPEQKKKSVVNPRIWRLVLTPMAGRLRNNIRFEYDIPTGPDETTHRVRELIDSGWGSALALTFVRGRFSLFNVFFIFPSVNSSMVVGDVLSANYHQPITWWMDVYFGLGFTYHSVRTDLRNFEDTVYKEGVGATAHFPVFRVKNDVFAPFPKLGLRFHLPIQRWHLTPYVSYLNESLKLRVQTPGGNVYIPPPVDDTKDIPELNIQKWKHYHSVLLGMELSLNFHHALQLRLQAHFNANHNKWTLRAVGSAFFHRDWPVGLTFYLEYSEGIVHDNIYAFMGPSFLY